MDDSELKARFDHLEKLITDLTGSLSNEVRDGFTSVNGRFDVQSSRLERHAALWQTGSRWSARMDAWAERVDAALEARAREIAELRDEIRRLRDRSNGSGV
jgi:hypothetical protein